MNFNNTIHHCEVTAPLQLDIMKNKIPLPDMTWSVKDINTFIRQPTIQKLMMHNADLNERLIEYIDPNYSSGGSNV